MSTEDDHVSCKDRHIRSYARTHRIFGATQRHQLSDGVARWTGGARAPRIRAIKTSAYDLCQDFGMCIRRTAKPQAVCSDSPRQSLELFELPLSFRRYEVLRRPRSSSCPSRSRCYYPHRQAQRRWQLRRVHHWTSPVLQLLCRGWCDLYLQMYHRYL